MGSPKADASKIDPWLKGPAENHRATEGAPCSFVNVWCLFDVCTILGGDTEWPASEGVTLPPVPYTLECPKAGIALAGNRQAIVTLHLPFGRLVLG